MNDSARGRSPQGGETKGLSVTARLMLMALVYLFVKRYVSDAFVQKAAVSTNALPDVDLEVTVDPSHKDVPAASPILADVDLEEDEFAGLSGSAGGNHDGQTAVAGAGAGEDALFGETASTLTLSTDTAAAAAAVPQVLVQYCMS